MTKFAHTVTEHTFADFDSALEFYNKHGGLLQTLDGGPFKVIVFDQKPTQDQQMPIDLDGPGSQA